MKRRLLATIALMSLSLVLLSGCAFVDFVKEKASSLTGGGVSFSTGSVVLHTKNSDLEVTVEIADTKAKREKGLVGRTKLEDGHGMWFVFQDSAPRTFWMKNTLMPLDVLFFDKDKKVVRLIEAMNPCTTPVCALYKSEVPASYALELPVGYVKAKGISLGNTVEVK